ncbi:MAG TPA: 50S ribosomal protein L6 [Fibrobacteres bacterium]|nr:50S ribosomal protein L6 [Fibrobacterota bacterium]
MSRVGKSPIKIPAGVKINVQGKIVQAEGPKGKLSCTVHERIAIEKDGDTLTLTRSSDSKTDKALHGTSRAVLSNVVIGVSKGWTKELEIRGVGYRGEQKGKSVNLLLRFSHPIVYNPPAGITVKVDGNVKLIVEGADRQQVGQVAATLRGFKPPEPYKGKGVRYANEQVIQKEVKKT